MKHLLFMYSIIAFMFFAAVIVSITFYHKDMNNDFYTKRINQSMNSANDAAIAVLQNDLTINAEDISQVNPYSAWEMYTRVFMNSFNKSGELSRLYFEEHTPVAILAFDDGFYIKMPATGFVDGKGQFDYISPDEDTEAYDLLDYTWSPKIPYSRDISGQTFQNVPIYRENTNEKVGEMDVTLPEELPIIVMDTMSGQNMVILDYNNTSNIEYTEDVEVDEDGNKIPVVKDDYRVLPDIVSDFSGYRMRIKYDGEWCEARVPVHDEVEITQAIFSTVTYMLNTYRTSDADTNKFYVPIQFKDDILSSVSSFKGMSLIVMTQDFDPLNIGNKVTTYSISNSQLVKNKMVYCYTAKDKTKYYTIGVRPSEPIDLVVAKPQDAAKLGYQYDFKNTTERK